MKKSYSLFALISLLCCGKASGPMERVEDLSEQRYDHMGSLVQNIGKEGIVISFKGSELVSSFSETKRQTNLYQSTLEVMQGTPYSVDPSGKTVYTDWFSPDAKSPAQKITILIKPTDIDVNVFTKRHGQAVKDQKAGAALKDKILGRVI